MNYVAFQEKFLQQFDTLPERLGGHIGLSLAALAVGILISIPLGIWVSKRPRSETIALTLASIIQTIPSLALLALMVFAFQTIGWLPAWIALILYSILPMLRGTVTGLQGVDDSCIEAANGIGMDAWQTLTSVELPLALPSIVSGIRTASVWVVGAATLAQPVGATSLGNYIFVGLQTWNIVAMLFGCLFSALLALAFDQLLRGLEVAANKRSWPLAIAVGVLIGALALSPFMLRGIGKKDVRTLGTGVAADLSEVGIELPLTVASKNFSESYILVELLKRRLEGQGLPVETKDGMGSTIVFNALSSGNVDCYVDYTGTIWANHMQRTDSVSPAEMLVDVAAFLKDSHGIISLGSLGFSNDYVFVMRQEDAQQRGIETLEDLTSQAAELEIGADIEFFDRPEWKSVQDAYGMQFKKRRSMEPTLMYGALEGGNVDVIVAFRTDGRTKELKFIEDTKSVLPPYDGVILICQKLARSRKAMKALRPLLESINSANMRQANAMVDIEGKTVEEAADWLETQIDWE